jgi:hypothetical protein
MNEQAQKQLATIASYQKVFASPEGKAVLEDLMRTHHCQGSTFGGANDKGHEIFFREGERNVVLRIQSFLNLDLLKLKERMENESQDV